MLRRNTLTTVYSCLHFLTAVDRWRERPCNDAGGRKWRSTGISVVVTRIMLHTRSIVYFDALLLASKCVLCCGSPWPDRGHLCMLYPCRVQLLSSNKLHAHVPAALYCTQWVKKTSANNFMRFVPIAIIISLLEPKMCKMQPNVNYPSYLYCVIMCIINNNY